MKSYLKSSFFIVISAALLLTGCGNKNKSDADSNIIETIGSGSDEVDFSYEISLLTNDYWSDNQNNIVYTFSDDYSFECESDNDDLTGTYEINGSDGYPLLTLNYSDDDSATYIMSFATETILTLTKSDTSEIINLDNVSSKPSEADLINSDAYSISFEDLNKNVSYPVLQGDGDAFSDLNKTILDDINEIVDEVDSEDNCSLSFSVKYSSDDFISIVGVGYSYSTGAAHPSNIIKCYNIDIQNQKILNISDFIDLKTVSEDIMNEGICSVVSDDVSFENIKDVNLFESSNDVKKYLSDTNNFYIDENKKLHIYFNVQYALGGYADVMLDNDIDIK